MANIVIDNMNAATASINKAGSEVWDWLMRIKTGMLSKVTGTSDIGFMGVGTVLGIAILPLAISIGVTGLVAYLIYRKYKSSKA